MTLLVVCTVSTMLTTIIYTFQANNTHEVSQCENLQVLAVPTNSYTSCQFQYGAKAAPKGASLVYPDTVKDVVRARAGGTGGQYDHQYNPETNKKLMKFRHESSQSSSHALLLSQ